MKKVGLFFTVLIFGATVCFSQTTNSVDVPKVDKNAPVLTFESTTHDFGNFFGGEAIFEFEFKNTGKEDLLLTDVHAGCGCTVIQDWPKEPIKKNKTGKIKVKYNNVTVPGKFSKVVTEIYSVRSQLIHSGHTKDKKEQQPNQRFWEAYSKLEAVTQNILYSKLRQYYFMNNES